jgi:hypothetical protein
MSFKPAYRISLDIQNISPNKQNELKQLKILNINLNNLYLHYYLLLKEESECGQSVIRNSPIAG